MNRRHSNHPISGVVALRTLDTCKRTDKRWLALFPVLLSQIGDM